MYLIIQIINLFINSFGYYLTADGFAENVIYIYIYFWSSEIEVERFDVPLQDQDFSGVRRKENL